MKYTVYELIVGKVKTVIYARSGNPEYNELTALTQFDTAAEAKQFCKDNPPKYIVKSFCINCVNFNAGDCTGISLEENWTGCVYRKIERTA